MSSRKAGERARITLKSLETLSYSCSDSKLLLDFGDKLQVLLGEFRDQLPQEEGLIVRPAIVTRAIRTKRKYAHIRAASQQRVRYSALPETKSGRKKQNPKFRNRVGTKADRLRKVSISQQ